MRGSCDEEPRARQRKVERDFRWRVTLVKRAAEAAFAGHAYEAFAVGAGRIDFVIDERPRCVTNFVAGTAKAIRHLGFFLVAGSSRTETLVEEADFIERRFPEGHVGADYAVHFDNVLAVVYDRKIEIDGGRADFFRRVFRRQRPPLHRGEFRMLIEEALDFDDVVGLNDQVVVEAYDDFALRAFDGAILDAAFTRTRVVEMIHLDRRFVDYGRFGSAVFGDDEFVFAGADLRREALDEASDRDGPRVRCDNDGGLQVRVRFSATDGIRSSQQTRQRTGLKSTVQPDKPIHLHARESGGTADAQGSGPCEGNLVGVQVPPLAPSDLRFVIVHQP